MSIVSLLDSTRFVRSVAVLAFVVLLSSFPYSAGATPFGEGVFGADVPFGSSTSLAINLGSPVSLNLTPSGANFTATGSHTITVTSTDAVGYELYARSLGSTNMTNGSDNIPTSANGSPAPLTVNSWGYNTNGSGNFLGMTTIPVLIKAATGPYKSGDNTTVTYSVLADITTPEGNYTTSVVYTAVAKTD